MKLSYTWWQAGLFAIFYDMLLLLTGWFLIGPPATSSSIVTFKVTATVGLPSIGQLLDAKHQSALTQFSSFNGLAVITTVVLFLVFALANAYYIGLLSRSVRELPGTLSDDVRQGWWPVLLFLIVQFVLSIIVMFPLITLGPFGGVVAVVLLLWFRYYYFFFEYVVIALKRPFGEAWRAAALYREDMHGRLFGIFIGILVMNALLTFLVNYFFSLPLLLIFLALNALVHSKIQEHVLRDFFTIDNSTSA